MKLAAALTEVDWNKYRRIVAITGAGMSAASGIATYRDTSSGTAWADPTFERISHAAHFRQHLPELWEFWGKKRAEFAAAKPNAGHVALADWAAHVTARGGSFTVATQNIDGLHTAAGSDTVELHGTIFKSACTKKNCGSRWDDLVVPGPGEVPSCPKCKRPARPGVVLFGEQLRSRDVGKVERALRYADLCLYIGTSGNVWPVAELHLDARHADKVHINPEFWPGFPSHFPTQIAEKSEVALPAIVATLRSE